MVNNKGLSLVELITVIAIMAVLTSIVAMGVSAVYGLDAKECVSSLNGYMKQAKTSALSKDAEELKIYQESDGKYYVDFVIYQYQEDPTSHAWVSVEKSRQTELIGKKSVRIECKCENINGTSGPSVIIDSLTNNSVTLGFNRSSGAFLPVKINDVVVSDEIFCTEIVVSRGSKSYSIEIIPETGKHWIK